MMIRTLCITILGIILVSRLSLSQESLSQELPSQKSESVNAQASKGISSENDLVTEIVTVKDYPVDELRDLILGIFGVKENNVHADQRSDRLIIRAKKEQLKDILNLIKQLDVPDAKSLKSQAIKNLLYRVYMFEVPSADKNLKPFSLVLLSSQMPSAEYIKKMENEQLKLTDINLLSDRDQELFQRLNAHQSISTNAEQSNEKQSFLIHGKTGSMSVVKNMVEGIPEAQIVELKLEENELFTTNLSTAHYTRLPDHLQKSLKKFLGDDIQTVAYWFGSSSLSGETQVPLGPWKLRLEVDEESVRSLNLRIRVKVYEELSHLLRRFGQESDYEILSNEIDAKIGKPIIIGYNRKSFGTRKMGAMVIIPEEDTAQLDASEMKTP